MPEQEFTDDEVLQATTGTHSRAASELQLAMEDFSKAVKPHLKKMQDYSVRAFTKLKR